MLIINTENDRQACTSPWGNHEVQLTMEEVVALFMGETLGDPNYDEYGLFIRMGD